MTEIRQPGQTIGRRYILEERLGQGGMGTVYRAYDRLTGEHVALKHVTLQKENLQFASHATSMDVEVALAQEFKTLASLRHPHIISVLDYGFNESLQPYFTMELLENAQDIVEAASLLSQDDQIQLLVQVLQALAYLHRRGIIHRDLKPDNVLVIDGHVKVLDFGLAISKDYLTMGDDVVAGTLAYMAPEILQGRPASIASDMYAVGVIGYEIFAEKYPFEVKEVSRLIHDIMFTTPDVTALGVDPLLEGVLGRLLAKEPDERYTDARELIRIYAEATNQTLKYETDTIRESFLQAAHFVGRSSEVAVLTQALQDAQNGRSSTWLVGGESGVGKSRLMDEMRTQALVQGMLAVRGEAISAGGSPYQVWREPLRRLILELDLTVGEASVLKPLLPDISRLLDQNIPDAPELDPQAAQDRLVNTVETLLRRHRKSLAIFLEDLQWAGSESIAMLDRLSRLTNSPVLIVGNYRDDEAPALPNSLPAAKTLKLERLEQAHIQQLSESMLGEAGKRQEVLELLQRETEGNAFFIVEVVRALAEEAGQLELIGVSSLPDTVFVGGVQNLIQRRLDRVPAEIIPVLQCAAVLGRQLDIPVLQHLDQSRSVNSWLTTCADAAVLEVQDNQWRFAHDKFRETLLRNLSEDEHKRLHQRVAEAVETVYHDNLPQYYALLAYHWTQAEVTDQALHYLEKAGEQALKNFANEEALEFFQKALGLSETGRAAVDRFRQAVWLRQIGQAYWGMGNLAALREHVEKALQLHDRPIPARLGAALLKQVGIQIAHRLRTPALINHNQTAILELVRAYKLLGQAYFFMNQANLTVYVTLQQLNLAEQITPSPELAEAYVNMCLVAGLVPMHALARTYERQGITIAENLKDTYIVGQASSVLSLYHLGLGQWEQAIRYIQRSTAIADQIGDRRLWESVTGVLALVYACQGKFTQAGEVFKTVYDSSRHSGNTQTYLWGMLGQAENMLPAGRFDEAWALLEEAQTVPIEKFGRDSEIRASALVAQVSFLRGDVDSAMEAAERALLLIVQSPPTSSWLVQHYAAVTEIFLSVWRTDHTTQKYDARMMARQMCKVMQRFARTFPIAQPRTALSLGQLELLEGRPEKAQKVWQAGLHAARALQMPYDEALLHFAIGQHIPQVPEHLHHALEIFQRLEAAYDADRVRPKVSTASQ